MFLFANEDSFIVDDNRSGNKKHKIDAEYYNELYSKTLPGEYVKDKRVLDLGACLGAAGKWCLEYGCTTYTAIEIQKDYYELMVKNFNGDNRVKLLNGDLLEYLINTEDEFDLIICSGVIYAFIDYYSILRAISKFRANMVIINYAVIPSGVSYSDTPINNSGGGSYVARGPRISVDTMCFLMKTLSYDTLVDRVDVNIKNYRKEISGRAVSIFTLSDVPYLDMQTKLKNNHKVDVHW